MKAVVTSPVTWVAVVLAGLSGLWMALGAPVSLITQIAIYTLYGAGVNLLVGYTGLVPFGASVFFGCASYAAAFFLLGIAPSDLAALVFATLFAMLLAVVIGVIILRRRGLYFSLLTLAFSQIAFEIVFKWTAVTGGENGMQGIPRPSFKVDGTFHVFAVVTVVIGMWFLWRLVHAPFGRVLQAVRDNEQRASSLGYNTYLIKLGALTMMAGIVGYAGALLTLMLQGVYADNLSWQHAGDALLMTVLGGVHHFLGPLWGAIAFIILENRLSAIIENWWLLFAPIIIVFALASPEGLHGLAQWMTRKEYWTLTRREIPPRPERIVPYAGSAIDAAADEAILSVKRLSKAFGSLVTAKDISLDVYPFRLHSFIGPNGAGKTTFFNMLSGILEPNGGEILFLGHDITRLPLHQRARLGVGRSFQILSVFPNLTVFENVRVAVQAQCRGPGGLWRPAYADEEVNARTWSLLDAVGLVEVADDPCINLPHGAKRLLEIAVTLATEPKLLLLDEPLAGLAEADRQVVGALIRRLADTHAVLLIEHDIDRVLAMSDRISVLHQGRLIADGAPAEVAANPEVIAAYLGKSRDEQAQVGRRAAARAPAVAGKPLLEVRTIAVGYGGSTVLPGTDLTVHAGEAVALLGRNGVGKTTMLRAISGTLPVAGGRILFDGSDITAARSYEINRLGITIVPEGRRLFPNLTLIENLKIAARSGGFSFDQVFEIFPKLRVLQNSRAESLSGGERQMVAIARALVAPTRLILLDEPFEGLAPAIVQEVMDALVRLRGRVAMVIVEHHAETVLPIVDRAYVLVNGQVAYEGRAAALEQDTRLQAKLLGVVHAEQIGESAA